MPDAKSLPADTDMKEAVDTPGPLPQQFSSPMESGSFGLPEGFVIPEGYSLPEGMSPSQIPMRIGPDGQPVPEWEWLTMSL